MITSTVEGKRMEQGDGFDLARFSKARLVSLTDGIFAIAMTILALTLEPPKYPPHPTEGQIWKGIVVLLPNISAFVASFVILGVYWMAHHGMFRFIEQADRTINWLNIYYLLLVTLVPYTTNLYAGDEDSRIANTIFGANLILLGLIAYALWSYAIIRREVADGIPPDIQTHISKRLLLPPAVACIALLASLIQPVYAEYIYFALIPIFMASAQKLRFSFKKAASSASGGKNS